MADKEAITLGSILNRLMLNDDFEPVAVYVDKRKEALRDSIASCSSVADIKPHIVAHLAQRLDELEKLSDWIKDAIEDGAREKIKHDIKETEGALSA